MGLHLIPVENTREGGRPLLSLRAGESGIFMRQSVNFLLLLALSGSASEDTASNDQLWCPVCTVLREIKFYTWAMVS